MTLSFQYSVRQQTVKDLEMLRIRHAALRQEWINKGWNPELFLSFSAWLQLNRPVLNVRAKGFGLV